MTGLEALWIFAQKAESWFNIADVSIDLDVSCDGKAYPNGH